MPKRDLQEAWKTFRAGPIRFARRLTKQLLVSGAERRIAALPRCELSRLLHRHDHQVKLSLEVSRHAWSLGAAEQLVLQMLIADRGVRTAFEFGTFNGATTALIAEALPDDGQVVTIDLSDEAFRATQGPPQFSATEVGRFHRQSPANAKVEQLRVDSLCLDVTAWKEWADLVLVDGAHDYEHGFADTRSALAIVRPGGIVIWDDFDPYWHGLVHGVLDAVNEKPISVLVGLPLAVLVAESQPEA